MTDTAHRDREARFAEISQLLLPDDLWQRIHDRAADYDERNVFFDEDLAELREHGYLKAFVPTELGGAGLGMHEVSLLQQRLAQAAPATALGINMHLVWTGVAHAMAARGDHSHDFVLEETAEGEIFAFGISEAGNDFVLFGSTTEADPQDDGGYRFTGTKVFTSLGPVWTRLGVHGLDQTDPEAPRVVYGFVNREDGGAEPVGGWNPLGMRATQSRSTRLDHALVPADRMTRSIPVGPSPDLLTFAINANFQLLIASVYTGLAARALDLAVDGLRGRWSAKASESLAEVPEFRARIADMALEYEAVPPQLATYTREFDALVDHGAGWARRFVGGKLRAVEMAKNVVQDAIRLSGSRAYDAGSELSRLQRDVLAGMFHPAGWDAARPVFATQYLDEQ